MKVVSTLIICIILYGCNTNSDINTDAQRAGELFCKAYKLTQRAASGSTMSISESTKLMKESTELYEKLSQKYTNSSDAQKFLQLYNKTIRNCY